MDAKGVCTAHLDSSRSLPKIREKNLKFEVATYDPGLAIRKKNCDPQVGLLKWSSQDQDLLCLGMTFSCSQESLASRGTMSKGYTAPILETASLGEDNRACQRCLGDIRDSWAQGGL